MAGKITKHSATATNGVHTHRSFAMHGVQVRLRGQLSRSHTRTRKGAAKLRPLDFAEREGSRGGLEFPDAQGSSWILSLDIGVDWPS